MSMWVAIILFAVWFLVMLYGQIDQLREQAPPFNDSILIEEESLLLPAMFSRVAGIVIFSPVSIWVSNEEFIFLVQQWRDPRLEDNTWYVHSVRRDAVEKLIFIENDPVLALKKLGFSEKEVQSASEAQNDCLVLLLQYVDEHRVRQFHVFCIAKKTLPSVWYECALDYFREQTRAPIVVSRI